MKASESLRALFSERFGARVLFDEPLAPYLAYSVGGPAEYFVFPHDVEDLQWLRAIATEHRLRTTIIGSGTNLLVRDEGIDGIVISLRDAFQEIELLKTLDDGAITVRCGGGVTKPAFLEWALERGYQGLEFSAGVPGTIGGGIFMNAGTKYGCYADILRELTVFHFANGISTRSREQLYFGYREQTAVEDGLVLSTVFELKPGDAVALRTEVARIIAERAAKQPLDFPSCGSTFKNPEGFSAGRLIEKAGLKGLTCGGAEISLKHANFILNKNQATASDILSLIAQVQDRVEQDFGIRLEKEVIVLGRDPSVRYGTMR